MMSKNIKPPISIIVPYDYLKICNVIICHFKNRFINSSKNENKMDLTYSSVLLKYGLKLFMNDKNPLESCLTKN